MEKKIEVARSFSYKLNLGNYQTADFFCSQKAEVEEKDAEKKSEELYAFCRKEVLKSINSYLTEAKVKPLNEKKAQKQGDKWKAGYNKESKQEEINDDLQVEVEDKKREAQDKLRFQV